MIILSIVDFIFIVLVFKIIFNHQTLRGELNKQIEIAKYIYSIFIHLQCYYEKLFAIMFTSPKSMRQNKYYMSF